jgi:hypothetical protein
LIPIDVFDCASRRRTEPELKTQIVLIFLRVEVVEFLSCTTYGIEAAA